MILGVLRAVGKRPFLLAVAALATAIFPIEAQQAKPVKPSDQPAPGAGLFGGIRNPVFRSDTGVSWWNGSAQRPSTGSLLAFQGDSASCSIPLLEVPISKNVEEMPILRPRNEPDEIDRMPAVKLPAPPCKDSSR